VVSRPDGAGSATALGARVRELRRAAGLTQDELAAGRFTKQYVSQIERGEVVPSRELLDWLAGRLGVERELLETGVATADLERIERSLADGHRLLDEHRYGEALELFGPLRRSLPQGAPRSVHRDAVRGETWALIRLGRVTEAAEVLGEAARRTGTGDEAIDERAELAYLTAVCCYSISEIPAAQVEFARALRLLDEAGEPNDTLRLDIHQWRSRCYRRQRDWEAAREDIDLALELCEAIGDIRRTAEVNLQASLVAERQGSWVLARRYAEESRDGFGAVGDSVTVARVLNNLAGLNHSLGNDEIAVAQLREALGVFVAAGLEAEAGYVLSSLAEIHRERGDLDEAEHAARQAVELLQGRLDHVQETGTAQLVLARSHLQQGQLEEAEETLAAVDRSYGQTGSVSHLARSWMTRGELELQRRNDAEAARLYREAATALQPVDPATDF
jgi:tetratricopeptide (TPR) repeat protein